MPTLKCTKDETGYWTVGELYAAGYAGAGMLSLGDDNDPDGEWIAHPLTYADDENSFSTYHIPGCECAVQFEEVE